MKSHFLFFLILLGSVVQAGTAIEVSGAPPALAANIEAHFDGFEKSGTVAMQQRQIERRVRDAATALGYFALQYEVSWDGDDLLLQVEPGEPVRWLAPQLQLLGPARKHYMISALVEAAPFEPGTQLNQRDYEDFKRRWLELCRAEGFLDARYSASRLLIDPADRTARAVLVLDCGERYTIGSIRFEGSSIDPDLLERLSPVEPGQVFRRSRINLLRRNLENSRYFGLVNVVAVPGDEMLVDIVVQLTDAARHDIGLGLGYDTDSGVRARLRWDLPRLNSKGHTLHNEATLSQPIQEIASTYRIPLSEPLVKSLNFTAAWDRREVESTRTTVTRVDSWILDEWWDDWIASWGAGLYQETSREGDEPSVSTSYVLPRLTLNHVVRQLVPDPVKGHSTWVQTAGSAQALGTETEFVRIQAGYKRLMHLGGPHLLIGRVEAGVVVTDDIFQVPLSQRFFTGGDQTVRGYELNSLSPRNDEGDLTGGQYLNVASLEYSVRVLPSWRVALFTDAGRAYNKASAPWNIGSGIGARWLSPIGQVRVDIAFPVDNEFESGPRLHIFMGPLL